MNARQAPTSHVGKGAIPRIASALLTVAALVAGCASDAPTSEQNPGEVSADAELAEVVDHGCPGEYPDWRNSPYILPIPAGDTVELGLGNCSSSFHADGEPDAYAYDFDLAIGDEIIASRGGVVTMMDESQADFGGGLGNLVLIDHGDGTTGAYLHFTTDGVDVNVGDEIAQGDRLGASGASGRAGYPHLHFIVVETPADFPWTGVPVNFSNAGANPRGPASGSTMTAESS